MRQFCRVWSGGVNITRTITLIINTTFCTNNTPFATGNTQKMTSCLRMSVVSRGLNADSGRYADMQMHCFATRAVKYCNPLIRHWLFRRLRCMELHGRHSNSASARPRDRHVDIRLDHHSPQSAKHHGFRVGAALGRLQGRVWIRRCRLLARSWESPPADDCPTVPTEGRSYPVLTDVSGRI